MASERTAIKARNINVHYTYSEYKVSTFKEFVMRKMKGKLQQRTIHALKNIDLDIGRGESVALIGHNGSGKSTLLKVLAGIIEPPGCDLTVQGRIAPMIELGTGFDPELSGRENILLACSLMGLQEEEIAARTDAIISFSELRDFVDMPLKNYSSGMQARLGFACTTAVDPDILLVDEVLAVGDSNFAKKCLQRIEYLRSTGTTVVLVSHDESAVRTFCQRAYVLSQGEVKFVGNVEDALQAHQAIMHERYMEALPEEERAEILRKQKLAEDLKLCEAGQGGGRPKVEIRMAPKQDGEERQEIDVARAFTLTFEVTLRDGHLFKENVTFGIGLYSKEGFRLGGVNNKSLLVEISREKLKESSYVEVDFSFDEGVTLLVPGSYQVALGIHDDNLTRTIFCGDTYPLTVRNSQVRKEDSEDVLAIFSAATGFKTRFSQSEHTLGVGRRALEVSP